MGNKQSGGVYTEGDAARSYYSERPVHVTIHNNCTSSVHIYWVDFEGNAVPFMTAKPGQQSEMRTFEAHLWRVVSEDHGEPLGDYVATADMQQDVFIGDARSAKKLAASSAASDALSMISGRHHARLVVIKLAAAVTTTQVWECDRPQTCIATDLAAQLLAVQSPASCCSGVLTVAVVLAGLQMTAHGCQVTTSQSVPSAYSACAETAPLSLAAGEFLCNQAPMMCPPCSRSRRGRARHTILPGPNPLPLPTRRHVFCEACLKTALARYSACPRCQKANPGYTKLFL